MSIPEARLARDMDLKKAMRMGIDECLIALDEAYAELRDEDFWRYAVPGRHNIVTLVKHCLQQHDDYNGNLQFRLGKKGKVREWHFLVPEERFSLWGVPADRLPKPGDRFPAVSEVRDTHRELQARILENMEELSEEAFVSSGVGPWPRLGDIFFRATYHTHAHIRQIWLIRGAMGLVGEWPQQHYA